MSEFNVADLVATLRLDKGSYDSDLTASQRRTETFTSGIAKAGTAAGQTFKRGLTGASVATGIVAAGTVGLLASVTKTGLQYNILQQSSRAALGTLMGGAEKANVQMDKLDDFAQNSPFGKDIFIQAQQQLLGFGVEGKKVIPIMDAVQQAVAATGGSGQQISDITTILAQVSASGKITGQDLMQLGTRGINAAELIGKQMGKTGPEIKASITKGTLGADEAIDALTKGMQEKFGGATAKIKEQWTGAADRIKAATRDIGSAIAEPFIKAGGGGRAVVWGNEFADVLRAVESKIGPVVTLLTGRLNPAFNQLSGFLKDAKNAVSGFDVSSLSGGLEKMSRNAPALAGVAAAFAAMGTQLPILARMGLSINPLVAGIVAVVAASPELRGVFMDALTAAKPLIPILGQLAAIFSGVLNSGISATIPLLDAGVSAFSGMVSAAGPIVDAIGGLAEMFNHLPGPIQTAVVAFSAFALMNNKLGWVKDIGKTVGGTAVAGFGRLRTEIGLVNGAMEFPKAGQGLRVLDRQISLTGTSGVTSLQKLGTASRRVGGMITGGLKKAAGGIMGIFGGPWGLALAGAAAALGAYAAKQAEARQRTQEFKATLDESTGAITASTEALAATALAGDKGSKGFYLWSSGAEDVSTTLETLGKSVQDTASLVAEGGADYDNMIGTLGEYSDAVQAGAVEMDNFGNVISKGDGGAALDAWADKMGISAEAARGLSATDIPHLISALEKQRDAVSGASSEWGRANDSMAETPNATSAIADALREVGDAAAETSTRIQAYQTIIDVMNGITPDVEAQQRKLAESSRTLGEFFRETGEDGKKLNKGLISAKDGSIELSDAGDRLMGILKPQADTALAAALAASDLAKANGDSAGAAAAADAALKPMRDTIKQLGEDGLITKEQAKALSEALLGVPGKTSAIITDEGSIDGAKLKLQDLVAQLEATPDGEITIKENSPAVIEGLRKMGYEVTELPNGLINVKVDDNGTAGRVRAEVAKIKDKGVNVIVTDSGSVPVTNAKIQSIKDRVIQAQVTDKGTIMTVQGGINNIKGTTGLVMVTDDGTIRTVQTRINGVTGKKEHVYVDDAGTTQIVQGKIYGVHDGSAAVNVYSTGIDSVQRAINSITGKTVTATIRQNIYTKKYWGDLGKKDGGRVNVPKLAGGGRLPRTGLGVDQILGIDEKGRPTARVNDREWVINDKSSDKYDKLLGMINRDDPALKHFAGTFREDLAKSVPKIRVAAGGSGIQEPMGQSYGNTGAQAAQQAMAPASSQHVGQGTVDLSARSVQALARAVQPYLVVDKSVIAQANGASSKRGTVTGSN